MFKTTTDLSTTPVTETARGEAPRRFFRLMKSNFSNHDELSGVDVANWIYRERVSGRADPSTLPWLNDLVKKGMKESGHILNPLYVDLLEGRLSKVELGVFLRSYFWGSGYGFQRVVLKAAMKAHETPLWRDYIKAIILEENTPSSHCEIFRRFVTDQSFQVGSMTTVADQFNQKMVAGYSGRLDYAFGYALGIETEADYQISLLAVHYVRNSASALALTDFFEIHMSETGEEEHAKETCRAIEQLFVEDSTASPEGVITGFKQAILDTRDYILNIRAEMQLPEVTKELM